MFLLFAFLCVVTGVRGVSSRNSLEEKLEQAERALSNLSDVQGGEGDEAKIHTEDVKIHIDAQMGSQTFVIIIWCRNDEMS